MEHARASTAPHAHAPLPSGTVAFLFTDIEGSTVRWDRDAEAMQVAVRRHDDLMRIAIAAHNGHVFKTIGDAFCAVFWGADDAVDAALDAQRSLAAEDFSAVGGVRVRMAVHVGASDERDGDFFGPTLNRVARLLAIGHGGQLLLSNAAAQTAGTALPPEASLQDLGSHRLKDLAAPEQVFQVIAPDLPSDFPKLRSLNVFENNLPLQTSSFVGRESECAEIEALLADGRFVTIFGAGGLGKTRCALQVAADRFEEYSDGVWHVDFAPLSDPALVPNEIAALFGVQESPNRPMLDTLTKHLKNKATLLLLDNCEHVVEEASKTVNALLRNCSKVKIVATSREALKVQGEIVYQMPALGVPEPAKYLSAEKALSYSAIALFETRAQATQSQFTITDENAAVVADVCRRLDGIPLAIELAAARIRVLAPRQLAEKLNERFRVLTGGDRTALPRQQTMRALIDWSYDLLSEREQQFFRSLTEFAGYFTIDGITDVCTTDTIDDFDVLELLASLVEKSLVLAEHADDETRYRLLESIREYGREKLIAAGERETIANRHAVAYAKLAEKLELDFEITSQREWRARTETAVENVRSALAWSFGAAGDKLVGQRIAATLRRVLVAFAAVEARRWVAVALAAVDSSTPPQVQARLYLAEASLATALNQFGAALSSAETALAMYEQLKSPRGTAIAQRYAGRSLVYLGDVAAGEALLEKSLAALKVLGLKALGTTLRDLAAARGLQGDRDGARSLFAQALASFEERDDAYNAAITAGTLAEAEFRCGEVDAAVRVAEEGLAAARALGHAKRVEAFLLRNLAAYSLARESFELARDCAREALTISRNAEVEIDIVFALQHLASLAALRPPGDDRPSGKDPQDAARLLGYVDARLAAMGVVREYTEQALYDKTLSALRSALDAAALTESLETGSTYTEERAIAESLAV